MKISTEIGAAARLVGYEEAVRLVAQAGFDAWDFSLACFRIEDFPTEVEGLELARKLKAIGLEYGIVCNQSHAPFPSSFENLPQIKTAIRCSAEAGASICVVHPIAFNASVEENAAFYRELLPVARECDIKIAAENLLGWDDQKEECFFASCGTTEYYKALLDAVDDPYFVACVDIGHAEQLPTGEGAPAMIRAVAYRLAALHVHDNDRKADLHQLPLTMSIDFDAVMHALREVDYQGELTLEAVYYLKDHTASTVADGLRRMAQTARDLADRFEKFEH